MPLSVGEDLDDWDVYRGLIDILTHLALNIDIVSGREFSIFFPFVMKKPIHSNPYL